MEDRLIQVFAALGLMFLLALLPVQFYVLIRWDKSRIRDYIESRGGQLQSVGWRLLGSGWLGRENRRTYDVIYVDRDGSHHNATCQTALLAGVYFTHDSAAKPVVRSEESELQRLEAENRALRAEVERLKREGNRSG